LLEVTVNISLPSQKVVCAIEYGDLLRIAELLWEVIANILKPTLSILCVIEDSGRHYK